MAGENNVPLHTLAVRPGLGPYIHCDTSGRTSGLETLHPLHDFQGESFSFYCPPIL
jgi:hypothetical protein